MQEKTIFDTNSNLDRMDIAMDEKPAAFAYTAKKHTKKTKSKSFRSAKTSLDKDFEDFLSDYIHSLHKRPMQKQDTFSVSNVFGKVAYLYERVRNTIAYKSEHLLRRNAIERILARLIRERREKDANFIVSSLLRELIWAKYLANDSLPKQTVIKLKEVIEKYLTLIELTTSNNTGLNKAKQNSINEWFVGVASAEIEETLNEDLLYWNQLNLAVSRWIRKSFDWEEDNLTEEEKNLQVYIAVFRGLSKADTQIVRYNLLKVYIPDWTAMDNLEVVSINDRLLQAVNKIEQDINQPVQPKIFRFIQKQSAAFAILKEVIETNFTNIRKIISSPKYFHTQIILTCDKHYDEIRKKVNTGIVRSIVYLFITKVILALIVELPLEYFILNHINYLSLVFNTIIPLVLMFIIGISIRRPTQSNTIRIIDRIDAFVYKSDHELEKIKFRLSSRQKRSVTQTVFGIIYLFVSFMVFAGIALFLADIGYNIFSGAIFFMFISLVLLFGYRVRYTAYQLNVTAEKESIFSHIVSNLTLPFLKLGLILSDTFSKYNLIIIIMDFLIETPFKKIVKVFDDWTDFIKEKRNEVVEVPN